MRSFVVLIAAILFPLAGHGDDNIPVLKGRMDISVKQGTIICEFSLVNMPPIKDYLLLVNAGMNIRSIRNENGYAFSYERVYIDTVSYESFGYYIPDNTGKEKYRPRALQFSYVAKFPVVADTVNAPRMDWKGNIAFNGATVRAEGRQCAWYPVLYDVEKDKMYEQVSYDIEINCVDCKTIYLNGNAPVQGRTARFKSDKPSELFLFAGDYVSHNVDSTYFLNPDITEQQMKEFGRITNTYKRFYEEHLKIPYAEKITYVNTSPVSKSNAWLFVTYPTIINVGREPYGMKMFFEGEEKAWAKQFIGHELGHYYFGHYRSFNSAIGDVCCEGFSEYLSTLMVRNFFPDSIYRKQLDKKIKGLKGFNPMPLSQIKTESNYANRELYVYKYAPILLMAIEKEVGTKAMWSWMQKILQTPAAFTDYQFLHKTLSATLKNDKKTALIENKYFTSDASLENAINTLTEKQ